MSKIIAPFETIGKIISDNKSALAHSIKKSKSPYISPRNLQNFYRVQWHVPHVPPLPLYPLRPSPRHFCVCVVSCLWQLLYMHNILSRVVRWKRLRKGVENIVYFVGPLRTITACHLAVSHEHQTQHAVAHALHRLVVSVFCIKAVYGTQIRIKNVSMFLFIK